MSEHKTEETRELAPGDIVEIRKPDTCGCGDTMGGSTDYESSDEHLEHDSDEGEDASPTYGAGGSWGLETGRVSYDTEQKPINHAHVSIQAQGDTPETTWGPSPLAKVYGDLKIAALVQHCAGAVRDESLEVAALEVVHEFGYPEPKAINEPIEPDKPRQRFVVREASEMRLGQMCAPFVTREGAERRAQALNNGEDIAIYWGRWNPNLNGPAIVDLDDTEHPDVARVRLSHPRVQTSEPLAIDEPSGGMIYAWNDHDRETDEEWIPDDPDELITIVVGIAASSCEPVSIANTLKDLSVATTDLDLQTTFEIYCDAFKVLGEVETGEESLAVDREVHAMLEIRLRRDREARIASIMAASHAGINSCNAYEAEDAIGISVEFWERFDKHKILKAHESAGSDNEHRDSWAECESRIRNDEPERDGDPE